ncbi:MAG: DUF4364 family protein [Clostridia bacterium]|nr:DUF4364 family protein [Clostridia bacterium]
MKPNLENVYYRMNDKGEIKLSVLFCLRYADIPLSDSDLKHLMLSATTVDFLELCGIIDELSPDNYIKKVWRDEEEKYILTEQGTETIDVFDDKIMASVRASIKKTVDEYLKREGQRAQIKCEMVPIGIDAYNVDIELKEGKNTLLSMSIFAGRKERAARYAKGFRNNPTGLFERITEVLNEAADESEKEE